MDKLTPQEITCVSAQLAAALISADKELCKGKPADAVYVFQNVRVWLEKRNNENFR